MNKKDVVIVIVVAFVSLMIAYFGMNNLVSRSEQATIRVKEVATIDSKLEEPSRAVFNQNSINPTVKIIIGQSE